MKVELRSIYCGKNIRHHIVQIVKIDHLIHYKYVTLNRPQSFGPNYNCEYKISEALFMANFEKDTGKLSKLFCIKDIIE